MAVFYFFCFWRLDWLLLNKYEQEEMSQHLGQDLPWQIGEVFSLLFATSNGLNKDY